VKHRLGRALAALALIVVTATAAGCGGGAGDEVAVDRSVDTPGQGSGALLGTGERVAVAAFRRDIEIVE
jgi:hypothetical protein